MDTYTITNIVDTLDCYTRPDGSSFLTSPSLREMQANARDRQARELGPTLPREVWSPYKGSVPVSGFAGRWLPEHGWSVVCVNVEGYRERAPLPDLPDAVDHPVFEPNPVDARNPSVVGGNRSVRGPGLYIRPTDLGMGCGVFFHTKDLNTYRDGGSWTIGAAHLVMLNETGKPHYSWGRDGFVSRLPVQVIAAVEWPRDPARPNFDPAGGLPVVVSQRELLLHHVGHGQLQRVRLTAMHGELGAILPQLVDTTPDKLTKSEIELLACMT
jgi:hypothetical protein